MRVRQFVSIGNGPFMHCLQQGHQALPQRGQAVFHARRNGFVVFAGDKASLLQLAQLTRQCPVRNRAQVSLEFVKSVRSLGQPIDNQQLPAS